MFCRYVKFDKFNLPHFMFDWNFGKQLLIDKFKWTTDPQTNGEALSKLKTFLRITCEAILKSSTI